MTATLRRPVDKHLSVGRRHTRTEWRPIVRRCERTSFDRQRRESIDFDGVEAISLAALESLETSYEKWPKRLTDSGGSVQHRPGAARYLRATIPTTAAAAAAESTVRGGAWLKMLACARRAALLSATFLSHVKYGHD
jgi:hypothetical protein